MFRDTLESMMQRTEGCLGVLVMGTDGIAVEKVWQPAGMAANLDVAIAEFTSLMRSARRTNEDLGLGELREISISSEKGIFIMRLVSAEYFIAMILRADGNFGRGRYELQRAEIILEKEFIV